MNTYGKMGELDGYTHTNEPRPPTHTHTRINSKWTKDLNVSHDAMEVLAENTGKEISDIPCSSIFADIFPKARDIKEKINKWDYIEFKSFCMAKEITIKMKREPTVWENIFANDTSHKGLISNASEELIQFSTRKTNNPIKKWAKDLNRHLSKEDIQRAQRHMKIC